MSGARALLFAFFGDTAWFMWTTTHQSTGACSSFAHYTPSATLALIVITGLSAFTEVLVMSPTDRRRLARSITRNATATACLSAIGLAVAVFLSAVVSCSGG